MVHEIKDFDIIVMYSDGVSDNLYPLDFLQCVRNNLEQKSSSGGGFFGKGTVKKQFLHPQDAADCIAKKAYKYSMQTGYKSPFARSAQEHYLDFEDRGKPDDITVIVSQIHSKNDGLKESDPLKQAYKPQKVQGTGFTNKGQFSLMSMTEESASESESLLTSLITFMN